MYAPEIMPRSSPVSPPPAAPHALPRRRGPGPAAPASSVLAALAACFPTPAPQHAVWAPGVRVDVPVSPLPALAHHAEDPDDDEAAGFGVTWPGLVGGRMGYGNRRVRAAVGVYVGLTIYGDASLALRVAQAGRLHLALAGEAGVGGAGASSAAVTTLTKITGVEELDGAFTWARFRPLISHGPRSPAGRGNVFTLGGVYGTFAGVREQGFSVGYLRSTYERGRRHGGDPYESPEERWGGGFDLYALWHGDASGPSVLLTINGFFGRTGDTDP